MSDLNAIELKYRILDDRAEEPSYAHEGDAGLDLRSIETRRIKVGDRALIKTGLAVAIPDGYAGYIQPRSGFASAFGVTVLNTPGLIDSGYRGEVKVLLANLGDQSVVVRAGDRIAQLVIVPVPRVRLVKVEDLGDTERADGGFGSTGR